MKLGAFSISLSVQNLKRSQEFYEKLGFETYAGDFEKNYLIMKNGNALVGLFHGMFENNILTFNPGWDENATALDSFDDIRKLQKSFIEKGLELQNTVDPKTSGPASLILTDPDGNTILIYQHL